MKELLNEFGNNFGLILSSVEVLRYVVKLDELGIYIIDYLFGIYVYTTLLTIIKTCYPKGSSFEVLHLILLIFTILYIEGLYFGKKHRLRPKLFSLIEKQINREIYLELIDNGINLMKKYEDNDSKKFLVLIKDFFERKRYTKEAIKTLNDKIRKEERGKTIMFSKINVDEFKDEIDKGFPLLLKLI